MSTLNYFSEYVSCLRTVQVNNESRALNFTREEDIYIDPMFNVDPDVFLLPNEVPYFMTFPKGTLEVKQLENLQFNFKAFDLDFDEFYYNVTFDESKLDFQFELTENCNRSIADDYSYLTCSISSNGIPFNAPLDTK